MNDNEMDNFLKNKFRENNVSSSFSNQVDKIVGDIFEKRRKKKKLILVSLPVLLTSTVVFAVSYSIFNLSSVGIDDSCLNIAAENGYIQTLDTEWQEFDGLKVKVNKFLIDDINLDISFEYKVNKEINEIKNIYIQDLSIYDENDNLLYSEKEKNENKAIAQTIGYSKIVKIGEGFENTFFAQSDNFPRSKKIFITFNNVILNCKHENVEKKGNWKYEIDILPEMIERKNINYKAISNNNNGNIVIKNMKMTNTGLIVNAESSDNKTLDNAKITVIVDNNKFNANSNIFEKNVKQKANRTEYIYTYNLTKYNSPKQITVRIKEKNKEKDIIFIKDE